ncbi:hypothetical protein HD597_006817 [Nonomuraea thailandensis]|uniref:Uncharacterized protein n=1 Tax=Nonomuraea thailandensis TaxID=1188745 RepID=A0A9X2K3T3_9ACTN|nr:hypothetical protein [Nonomuraea thailandensis]MCP2359797.1 hypothetical protein [Nonomuraea thailandensis]
MTSISGYITRDEIAQVAGLLCAKPGESAETASVQATAVEGQYENALTLTRAWVEVQEVRDEARRDADHYGGTWELHMPNRPELFDLEYDDEDQPIYSHPEDYDEAEDRRVAIEIVRTLSTRYGLTPYEMRPQ